ncbi:MAG: Glu-tRNA(Gln) amidotransferase subunit GatE [Candidatus Iainarchaeum archaeon]|uniref:Glutamyl-tRNA(Gln) amidotransferase subunit E n=1 Tax=Candidatus Iainarchaeum sp. TaxID=3101447 RepID=A0A7T9DJL2_9ARCH|nr:MAG: Glu-tRNA(Gln) amidotransferase subunit GatE [Candidatus Diapherotrites archaeon]
MPNPPGSDSFPVTCGLEVHQQLDTGKLFCRCPTKLSDAPAQTTFHRQLHAVASEFGEFDVAALEAIGKEQTYHYQALHESACLVEADDEPPHGMDANALKTAMEVSLLCHSTLVDKILVMRKTVLDGSNTSGFQRTALISMGGQLELQDGKVIRIQNLMLEEDSCRPVERKDHEVTYRLDRLGFPLIELSTMPDIHSPQQAKETALKMGEILRITGRVKRGLGTIRQDINISVPGGARVELKGVQEVELIDEYVRREMHRQNMLLHVKHELTQKGLTRELIHQQFPLDASPALKGSTSKIIQNGLQNHHSIIALRLPLMHGYMGKEIQPDRRVGTEVSNYVKARAHGMGILHGDELPKFEITAKEVTAVRKLVMANEKDSFALMVGTPERCAKAVEVIKQRVAMLLEGIPMEVRGALEGGNSEYLRPMPGAARMYPETDEQAMVISSQQLQSLQQQLPRFAAQRKQFYVQKGLSEKLAEEMKLDNRARFFERLIEKGYNPTIAATLLLDTLNIVRRENPRVDELNEMQLESLLDAQKSGTVLRDQFVEIVKAWASNPHYTLTELLHKLNFQNASSEEVNQIIEQIVEKNMALVIVKKMDAQTPLMGHAMKALRGKASGQTIAAALQAAIKKRI